MSGRMPHRCEYSSSRNSPHGILPRDAKSPRLADEISRPTVDDYCARHVRMILAAIGERPAETERVHERLATRQAGAKSSRALVYGVYEPAGVLPANRLPDRDRDGSRCESVAVCSTDG